MTATRTQLMNRALKQLNNAANNLFDAAEVDHGYPKGPTGLRQRVSLQRARTVALSLAHMIEYGRAYKPQFESAAGAFADSYPVAFDNSPVTS